MSQLTLVATPIGNLQDMTFRAIEVLKSVDIIACEDTRRARQLLSHFNIPAKRLLAHHAGNERKSVHGLLKLLEEGKTMAYVSDGGMPTVSDPGFLLTQAAIAAGIEVSCAPGASALTTALAVAGLPASRFTFLGFLPRKEGDQRKLFERFTAAPEALLFYESPNRLGKTLTLASEVLGNRAACVCRELTKLHEDVQRDTLPELAKHYAGTPPKGECAILIAGA